MDDAASGPGETADDTPDFRLLGEQELWRGWILTLGRTRWTAPDGEEFERDVVHHPGAVAIVPVHDDGSVTLVRQFRPAIGTYVYEIPAGTRDVEDETPEVTARRELAEEVGLQADRVEHLAAVYNSPGFTDQRTEIFMATGLRLCRTAHDGIEERWLGIHRLPVSALDELLAAGAVDETTALGIRLAGDVMTRRGARRA